MSTAEPYARIHTVLGVAWLCFLPRINVLLSTRFIFSKRHVSCDIEGRDAKQRVWQSLDSTI